MHSSRVPLLFHCASPRSFLLEMTFREFACATRWIYVEENIFLLSLPTFFSLSLGDENRQQTGTNEGVQQNDKLSMWIFSAKWNFSSLNLQLRRRKFRFPFSRQNKRQIGEWKRQLLGEKREKLFRICWTCMFYQRSSGVFGNTLQIIFRFFKKILHEKVFNFRCSSLSFHPLPLKAFRKSFSPLGTQSCMPSMISFSGALPPRLVKLHFPSTLWQITKSIIRHCNAENSCGLKVSAINFHFQSQQENEIRYRM